MSILQLRPFGAPMPQQQPLGYSPNRSALVGALMSQAPNMGGGGGGGVDLNNPLMMQALHNMGKPGDGIPPSLAPEKASDAGGQTPEQLMAGFNASQDPTGLTGAWQGIKSLFGGQPGTPDVAGVNPNAMGPGASWGQPGPAMGLGGTPGY